ncbi:MAG: phasin family protein [Muricomes sp.]
MEFNESLKKIFLAGVGAVATTAETAKDVVDNLVKKGEITVEQGKVLNEELKQNVKEKVKEHVSVTVVREYKDAMAAVEHMQPDELAALKAKIEEVESAAAQTKEESCCSDDSQAPAGSEDSCSDNTAPQDAEPSDSAENDTIQQ